MHAFCRLFILMKRGPSCFNGNVEFVTLLKCLWKMLIKQTCTYFGILLKTISTYHSAHSMSSHRNTWPRVDSEVTRRCCRSCPPCSGRHSTRGWSNYWVETACCCTRTAYATGNTGFITAMSYERHGIPNQRQLSCSFGNFFKLTEM